MLYIANIDEAGLAHGTEGEHASVAKLRAFAESEHAEMTTCSAKLEAELIELDAADRAAMMQELGLRESALPQIIRRSYALLQLVTFFTTVSNTETQVVRYTAVGDVGMNRTVIVPNIPTSGANHNGGGLAFGSDGKLYICVGESGSAGQGEAQLLTSYRGKILRVNADGSIPVDNPFGNLIWSYGHRHPFGITVQPGKRTIANFFVPGPFS